MGIFKCASAYIDIQYRPVNTAAAATGGRAVSLAARDAGTTDVCSRIVRSRAATLPVAGELGSGNPVAAKVESCVVRGTPTAARVRAV